MVTPFRHLLSLQMLPEAPCFSAKLASTRLPITNGDEQLQTLLPSRSRFCTSLLAGRGRASMRMEHTSDKNTEYHFEWIGLEWITDQGTQLYGPSRAWERTRHGGLRWMHCFLPA